MSFCKLEAIQSLFYPGKMKHLVQTLVVSRFETLTFCVAGRLRGVSECGSRRNTRKPAAGAASYPR